MAIKTVRMPGVVVVADPGNGAQIPVPDHHNFVCLLTSGGSGETRTMAVCKFPGQRATIAFDVDGGGNVALNVGGDMNSAGNDTATFANAGQAIDLTGVQVAGALRWRCVVADPTSILS